MRIIIYGIGKVFERYREKIKWDEIVAIADKNSIIDKIVHGFSIIPPSEINKKEYDFIAIFSNKFFEEIRMELAGEYFIPNEKIVSWRAVIDEELEMPSEILKSCKIYFEEKKCRKILDVDMAILPKICLTKEALLPYKDVILDGILSPSAIYNVNLYDHIYKDCNDSLYKYDVALLYENLFRKEDIMKQICRRTKYIFVYSRHSLENMANLKLIKDKLQSYGKVKYISGASGLFWMIDTKEENVRSDASIYVVTHKKYNIRSDQLYKPICVGGFRQKGYLTEQEGHNIAYLNKKINECTALYWIWKNTNTKYIGLNHYRRFFYSNEIKSMDNYLDLEHIENFLEEYDIILPVTYLIDNFTLLDHLKQTINQELCQKGYLIIRSKIKKYQPDYLEAFDSVMTGYSMFLCNMFVTKREILNGYCEWLFSFLIEAAEETDVDGYDDYSQRVIGFFAERMLTVWLRKNRLKIKQLPFVIVK